VRPLRIGTDRVSSETARVLPVLAPVVVLGAAAAFAAAWSFAASRPDGSTGAGAAALLVAWAIAEALPVWLEGVEVGRTSLATVFIVAAAILYGWSVATLVATLAMASGELRRLRGVDRLAYNMGVYALAGAAAGVGTATVDPTSLGRLALAALLASAAFYLVDICLVAAIRARAGDDRPVGLLGFYVVHTLVPFGVLTCLAFILVVLWHRSPAAALALGAPLASIILYERRIHNALTQLRELDRLKDEFIAVVSHEMRTPLATVHGAAETLRGGRADAARRDLLIRIVWQETARLAAIMDQFVQASRRLESEPGEPKLETLDGVHLAQDVVDASRVRLPPHLRIELVSQTAVPPVQGDAQQIKQVLVNLIENAVKYSPNGSRIEVALASTGDRVQLSVKDDGPGIPATEHEAIFEKFHRLDPNMTRGVAGTGLGLYICRQLVESMNGRIWVESQLGTGSKFVFELHASMTPPSLE
jgi:signal transduction histidine kinase